MSDQSDKFELEVGIPVPEGLRVSTETPYRILFVSDLAGSEQGTLAGPLLEKVVDVTADSFDAVLAAAAPSLRFTLADPLDARGAMAEAELRFNSLRAMEPRDVVRQIHATSKVAEFREQLVARLRGKLSAEQLASAASKAGTSDAGLAWVVDSLRWSAGAPAAGADVVDGLLGQIDVGEPQSPGSAPPAKTPVGALVSAAAGGAAIPAEEASAVRRTLAELDRRITQWLTAVLHAPPFQAMETAWRSLAFLVANMDFRKGLRLSVLHAPRNQLAERFRSLLIDPVFDQGADAPDVIVADYAFGNTAPDIELLDELAQHGASLPAVVLAGVSAAFFGVKQAWQVPTLPAMIGMFDQWQFAKWKTLREQPYARSIGVFFGRGLLRAPCDRDDAADLDFTFREQCFADKDMLWAGGAVAAAAAIARSVAENGWPTAIAGVANGRVHGFATAQGGPGGNKTYGPTDTQMPQAKIEECAGAGINVVAPYRDQPDAVVWNGLTAARPRQVDYHALLEVSLPYQLFAARLSSLLLALKPHLAGMDPAKVVPFVRSHVCDWLSLPAEPAAEQLMVQAGPVPDGSAQIQLAVTVTPPDGVLPGGIPIVLGYRLS